MERTLCLHPGNRIQVLGVLLNSVASDHTYDLDQSLSGSWPQFPHLGSADLPIIRGLERGAQGGGGRWWLCHSGLCWAHCRAVLRGAPMICLTPEDCLGVPWGGEGALGPSHASVRGSPCSGSFF